MRPDRERQYPRTGQLVGSRGMGGPYMVPEDGKAGLKYFAHLFSPSLFSQLSAQKSIDIMAGIITTQYFTDIKLAEAWVDHFPK